MILILIIPFFSNKILFINWIYFVFKNSIRIIIIQLLIEYRLISKKGEGTFSEVLKAQSIKTGKYVAIKCMKAHFYNIDQVIIYMLIK